MKRLIIFILITGYFGAIHAQDTSFQKIIRKNYTLSIPASWTLDSAASGRVDLVLRPTEKDESPGFAENINVLLQDLSAMDIDIDGYKTLTEEQVKNVPNFLLTESVIISQKGNKFYRLQSAFNMGTRQLKAISYCFIKDKTAYLVTYTAEESSYEIYWKDAAAILDSFEVK